MGTSQSSPGPGGGSPLVPPWADDQPQQPLPSPQPRRFKPFRQSIGNFIGSGDTRDLRSALGHYARTTTGGGGIAGRRMGTVTNAGAALYGALTSGGFGPPGETEVSLNSLSGLPCDIAIDTITRALTADGGDSDKIRIAMNHALVEALDGIETFDPTNITDEVIVDTMIGYLAESVFLQIIMDAGKAWTKAETPTKAMAAENALCELVKVIVDKHMAPKFAGNVRSFSRSEIVRFEKQVISEVWDEWEKYH